MQPQQRATEICPTTAQKWLQEGAWLLDVREQDEVDTLAFDVPKLLHLPLSTFEERFAEVPKDEKVVVACRGGSRSLKATYYLHNHGYSPDLVVSMQHGLLRWVAKEFPTKGDTASLVDKGCNCCSSGGCC